MTKFLNDQPGDLQEYDEQLVRSLIEKITVLDDKLTIEFKSCVEIDIEIYDHGHEWTPTEERLLY